MNVKFIDGTIKECTPPTEQKLLKKTPEGEFVSAGWVASFHIIGVTDSTELDRILTPKNTDELIFSSNENDTVLSLKGYTDVSSVAIRHAEDNAATRAEIQFIKGGV
jgi:hypothetical protein